MKAAMKTKGGSGPSGLDADGWRRAEQIEVNKDNEQSLEVFKACRLIPLNKNPGLRPIGVSEIFETIADCS